MPQFWTDPSVIVPAASGLIGSIIGGAMAIWGGYRQARQTAVAADAQRKQEFEGLKIAIDKARTPNQFTAAALRLKEFYFRNPQTFGNEANDAFFAKHLQDIHPEPAPGAGYWDDARKLAIKIDVTNLSL